VCDRLLGQKLLVDKEPEERSKDMLIIKIVVKEGSLVIIDIKSSKEIASLLWELS
jgi:hypothetical protein